MIDESSLVRPLVLCSIVDTIVVVVVVVNDLFVVDGIVGMMRCVDNARDGAARVLGGARNADIPPLADEVDLVKLALAAVAVAVVVAVRQTPGDRRTPSAHTTTDKLKPTSATVIDRVTPTLVPRPRTQRIYPSLPFSKQASKQTNEPIQRRAADVAAVPDLPLLLLRPAHSLVLCTSPSPSSSSSSSSNRVPLHQPSPSIKRSVKLAK